MRKWQDVPLPDRMASLPRDRRGFPIPVIVARDLAGEPLFTINDERAVVRQRAEMTCGICGGGIDLGQFCFLGGPGSAFLPHGAYLDGPLHRECAEYAARVCPYLAAPKYSGRVDDLPKFKNGVDFDVAVDMTQIPDRPEVFVLIQCMSYDLLLDPVHRYFIPVGEPFVDPRSLKSRFLDFDVYQQGRLISDEREAQGLIRVALQRVAAANRQSPKFTKVDP